MACQPLWKNNFIHVNNKCVFYKTWYKKGIIVINDLLDDNGNFLSFDLFRMKYDLKANFLQYIGIRGAIRAGYDIKENLVKVKQPLRPDTISLICKYKKGCSHIYALFQEYDKP